MNLNAVTIQKIIVTSIKTKEGITSWNRKGSLKEIKDYQRFTITVSIWLAITSLFLSKRTPFYCSVYLNNICLKRALEKKITNKNLCLNLHKPGQLINENLLSKNRKITLAFKELFKKKRLMFIISYCLTRYYKKYLEIKGVAFVSREIFKLNIFKRVV